jgi:hypothetical protein
MAKVEIDILLPSTDDSDPPDGGRQGVTRRTIHIWINDPSSLRWHARPDQLPSCRNGRYKDGDQESKDVPPGGSAFYDDTGELIFKLLGLKPGTGRDPIRPNAYFEREGFWVKKPFPFPSRDFTCMVSAVTE